MRELNWNKLRIAHIEEAIGNIQKFTLHISQEEFCSNDLVQSGVLFQFSIIGEAIIHVDPDKLTLVDYPWHFVRGFRNFIAHEYHKLKMEAVWNIIENELPKLKVKIQELKAIVDDKS